MIYVHKLGESYYKKNEDHNSGSYETALIKQILSENFILANDHKDADKILIISGLEDKTDQAFLDSLSSKQKKIYIATDIDHLPKNKEYDLVLHQFTSPNCNTLNFRYSYIPELFYRAFYPSNQDKIDRILFAGSTYGREEKIEKFLEYPVKSFKILKNDEFDERLEYKDYLKLASLFKYHLITVTYKAIKDGWVTSRFVESLALGAIPIVDKDYDIFNHFNIPSLLKVTNKKDVLNAYENFEDYKSLEKIKHKIMVDSYNFQTIINEV